MKIKFIIPVVGLLFGGCYHYDVNGSHAVRYANSVNVIRYDSTPRPIPPTIQIFDRYNPPPAKYVPIASISRGGFRRDEQMIVGALQWRARQLGANGIIIVGESSGDYIPGFVIGNANGVFATEGSSKPIFRGVAIWYDANAK